MNRRSGMTLIEMLVVIAIIAVLIALLIPAIMKIREVALLSRSKNNMRQIVVAIQSYASDHENRMPSINGKDRRLLPERSLFAALVPYVAQEALPDLEVAERDPFNVPPPTVKLYISPADPTIRDDLLAPASYAANAQVFQGSPSLVSSFLDGKSTTIAFAEHYAKGCGASGFHYALKDPNRHAHRATFADGGPNVDSFANCSDLYPITTGNPPTSKWGGGITFQVAPYPFFENCNPQIAQTPHKSGMVIALGDGSIRTIDPGISETTYWGAITPRGRERLGEDW